MSVGAIGAEILGGGGIHPPPWYTSLKHPMVLGVKKHIYILTCPVSACKIFCDCLVWPSGAYVSKEEPQKNFLILKKI